METFECSSCGVARAESEYHTAKRRAKVGGRIRRKQCKECVNKYNRDNRERNSARYNKRYRDKRIRNKEFGIEYLGGRCSNCLGIFHRCVYDFHHTDPNTKEMDATTLLNLTRAKMIVELDKCILLCANCHRLEHFSDET